MSVVHELSQTITLDAAGDATAYSTGHVNGFIDHIYLSISKAAGAADAVTITETTGSGRTLLKVLNPSTVGAYYHPRASAVGTTNNALSTDFAVPISIYKEKYKIVCACSSGLGAATVSVKLRWY